VCVESTQRGGAVPDADITMIERIYGGNLPAFADKGSQHAYYGAVRDFLQRIGVVSVFLQGDIILFQAHF